MKNKKKKRNKINNFVKFNIILFYYIILFI